MAQWLTQFYGDPCDLKTLMSSGMASGQKTAPVLQRKSKCVLSVASKMTVTV